MAFAEFITSFYWGVRLDIGAIFYSNFIFFVYYFLFSDMLPANYRKTVSIFLLLIINLPFFAINVIDLAYYKFTFRRSTVDLFAVITGSLPAIGSFWKAWWWLFLLFIVLCVVAAWFFNRILKNEALAKRNKLLADVFIALCFLVPLGLLARGLAERPLIPSSPLLYLPANDLPLASNSTFTVLYSVFKHQTQLKEKNYFSPSQLDTLFTAKQQFHSQQPFNKMNVVVFVMESFAKEYIDTNSRLRAKTPFLDSIMAESIVCNNGYTNGLESNKGLVAILGSIPPFFDEPYYYSAYSSNNIRGIGSILKEEGYNTSFFMGAGYDHFGFARFSKMLGIDNYYSIQDYGNDKHFDGNWGIYDHYFLPYAARTIVKKKTPFFSTIFNISTHFPYKIPDSLKNQFTINGQIAEQNSMSYLDYSLRLFFDVVKNETWYNNTLFVFSADHNIYWDVQDKADLYKTFMIPIFFYLPGEKNHRVINKTVQQLDIIPSILDLLHYNQSFMSFGKSVFDTLSPAIAINHFNDLYQAIDSNYLFGYNERTEQPAYLYNFRQDTALSKNLLQNGNVPNQHAVAMEQHLKAVMQYFNNSMIKNKLFVK